jgi:hypothetical protein
MGEIAGPNRIGFGEPWQACHEFGGLNDEKIEKIALQEKVAAGLRGKMGEVEQLGARFIS